MVFGKKPVTKVEEKRVEKETVPSDDDLVYQSIEVAETVRPAVRNVQTEEIINPIEFQVKVLNDLEEIKRLLKLGIL